MLALLAQVSLPSLGQEGPDDLRRLLSMFLVLMGVGFLVAIVGHLVRSRTLVAIGLALVFLGTGVFMVAVATEG